MKKFTLILLLVILISLFVVIPAFAGGDGPHRPGKACEKYGALIDWGYKKGLQVQIDKFGNKRGRAYGPVIANDRICYP